MPTSAERIARTWHRALTAGAVLLALALAAARVVTIPTAPIIDPLEAREFQLAAILGEQGWAAFAAALTPADFGSVGAVLPVAAVGALAGGFGEIGILRLPAFLALVFAGSAAYVTAYRLTGRAVSAAFAAAALFAAPSTGLIGLSATADAFALLALVAVVGALGWILRWGGDSWLDHPENCHRDEIRFDPPRDRRADLLLIEEARRDDTGRSAALLLWAALGLGTWFAGAAIALFAGAAILGTAVLFRLRLVRRHPALPPWRPGRLLWLPGLALALAIAALPQLAAGLLTGEWRIDRIAALLQPRPDAGLYPAAPLGWASALALLCWPSLAMLPLAYFSRLNWGAARETFVVVALAGWIPVWALVAGDLSLALMLGSVAGGLLVGYLVNYAVETRRRARLRHAELFGPDVVWFVAAGLAAAGAVAAVAVLFGLAGDDGFLVPALLLAVILLIFPVAWAAIERSVAPFALSVLAVGALAEVTATGLMLPAAGAAWPGARVAEMLAPFRACGAGRIGDETGFDTGFLHHSGPRAVGPGDAAGDRLALMFRGDDQPPAPRWIAAGWIDTAPPLGAPARIWLFANPDAAPGDGLSAASLPGQGIDPAANWSRCLRVLALRR